MKTDALIALLASNAVPVQRRAASRRLWFALLAGLSLSALYMGLALGIRRDLMQVMFWPLFWIKLAFSAAVTAAGFALAQRLARPGVKARAAWLALAAPVLAVWAIALAGWEFAPPSKHAAVLEEHAWPHCVFNIVKIAAPVLVAALLAMKSLAPTQPILAGAAAGAMAGGASSLVYAFHCPELGTAFLAIWHLAGTALPMLIGALVGPRLLRW